MSVCSVTNHPAPAQVLVHSFVPCDAALLLCISNTTGNVCMRVCVCVCLCVYIYVYICHKTIQDCMYRNSLLYVIEMLRDICEMCYICVRGKGDTCKIAKRYVMYFGILARIGKRILGGRAGANLKKWREIRGEIMAGDLQGRYGGTFRSEPQHSR